MKRGLWLIFFVGISLIFMEITAESATVTINAIPWGHVYIDGKKIDQGGSETPIINYPISAGDHLIAVKRKSFKSYKNNIKIIEGEHYIYSARLQINQDDLGFKIIHGGDNFQTMYNIALIIGPEILEERYYKDIVKYVRGFGELDTVMLYSYEEGEPKSELNDKLGSSLNILLKYTNKVNISYYNRYMKTEKEIEELREIMKPYENKKIVEYLGSCVFE